MSFAINNKMLRDRDFGQRTLLLAARFLESLANNLPESFERIVDLFYHTKGRIVVSGVGKSGHIGRKIAATLASTGQPSFFLHAAEAGHGDLGMISSEDTLFLLSYSGETEELNALIQYGHRLDLPIVSITGRPLSSLALSSKESLTLPILEEACPLGLAPTTSTTLTLALGDALSIALLNRRGFGKKDFGLLHPLGNLGQQLKQIRDIMRKGDRIPLVAGQVLMQDALLEMNLKGIGCTGILSVQNTLQGVITDGDLRRHMGENLLGMRAQDVMTKNPVTLMPHHLMADALALMEKKSITSVFITSNHGCVEGVVHIHDCLRHNVA